MKQKRISSSQGFDSNSQLRTILLASLAKLHSQSTTQTGYAELRQLISQLAQHQFIILIHLLDSNELTKLAKKDYIRLFGVLCELRGNEVNDHISKMVQIINKRIQEGDASFQQVISDTFANINEFGIQVSPNRYDQFLWVTDQLQINFTHNNKIAQQISASSLSRIIQTSEPQLLEQICKPYTQKILEILRSPHCRTQSGLLESILSLILTVEEIFESCLDETVHTIQNCFSSDEWTTRKKAVDIIYTLSVIFPDYFKLNESLTVRIGELRFDKIKHVRDAALIAISQLKENSNNVTSCRKYKSVFKMNANKDFFDRTSDILIVENRPRDDEKEKTKDQELQMADYLVRNEVLPTTDKKQMHTSPSQNLSQSKSQLFYSPPQNRNRIEKSIVSPEQQKLIEKVYQSFVAQQSPNTSNIPNLNQRERQLSSQSYEKSQQKQKTSSQQKSTDYLKIYDANKNKNINIQQEMIEQIVQERIKKVEENFKLEIQKLNNRIAKLEQNQQIQFRFPTETSSMLSPVKSDQQQIMQKVEEHLEKDNLNEAYSQALTSLDDQIIISTMLKTGPCAERLDSTQVEFLLHKLRTLDWIENALQHHLAKMPAILLKSIQNQLKGVPQTDQVQRIEGMLNPQIVKNEK